MQNFCLFVGFSGEKAQILHTWKIQVLDNYIPGDLIRDLFIPYY